ncbi:MAG: hypothetical protein LW823_05005 [Rickettsiales bacterium]|jgi:hypothetical protein|nr:hypothetical protein [Rickettsiales bacterium]
MSLLSRLTGSSKAEEALSKKADNRWHNFLRLTGDQSAYDPVKGTFGSSGIGIPERIELEYNAMLKRVGKKLWSGTIKAAGSGFGKGLLATAAILLVGFAIVSGLGAVGAGATFASGIGMGLSVAGNFMLNSWFGAGVLALGGTLGAVSDVRKHTNNLTADMARVEAEGYTIARDANLLRELQGLQTTQEKPFQVPKDQALEKECNYCAREMARRESAQQSNSIMR